MFFQEGFGSRYHSLVPAIIPSLVTAQEQQGGTTGIESVEDSVWPPGVLDTQLAELAEARAFDLR